MKKTIGSFLFLAFLATGTALAQEPDARALASMGVSEKLDLILKDLKEIKSELQVVKIRATQQ